VAQIGRIQLDERADGPLITLVGEFDLSNAPQLLALFTALSEEGSHKVTVDLSEVTFLDSTAMAALAMAYRMGLHLVLRRPTPRAARELQTAGLIGLFDLEG
jgi:anti-sigma B factor antagonist